MQSQLAPPPPGFTHTTTASNKGRDNVVTATKSLPPKTTSSGVAGKQKNKFVPLLSTKGQSRTTVLLPGRHTCQCLGQKHTLINNCLECGRIVCSQVRGIHCDVVIVAHHYLLVHIIILLLHGLNLIKVERPF